LSSVYGGGEQGIVQIAAVVYINLGPYYSTLAAFFYTVLPVDYFDGVEWVAIRHGHVKIGVIVIVRASRMSIEATVKDSVDIVVIGEGGVAVV
jgi:hypothetical protein